MTVAPETVPPALIRRLADNGVVVSLGHTDASYETVMAAADAGARGVTHLFNAMSQLQHRAPGVVGAALDHGGLWCGIIADGHHVHAAALSNALRAKRGPAGSSSSPMRCPPPAHDGDVFELNERRVTRRDGVLTLEDGTLAGSDLTMDDAVRFAVANLDVSLAEALRMASLYPATFLGLEERGRIAAGFRADLVHMDDRLAVREVWIGGENASFWTTSDGGVAPRFRDRARSEAPSGARSRLWLGSAVMTSSSKPPHPKTAVTARIARAVVTGRSYSGGRSVPPMKTASLRQAMALVPASKAAK